MKVRKYKVGNRGLRMVLLTDLHNRPYEEFMQQVRDIKPELIAVAGDVTYSFYGYDKVGGFMRACQEIAPTFCSIGNHDNLEDEVFIKNIMDSGAVLLNDSYTEINICGMDLRIGGLTSPSSRKLKREELACLETEWPMPPETGWLQDFCRTDIYKILLCHQPEFYPRYLSELPIQLILAGHAHGGQWRIGTQGIYAPGQGLFPKLTGGVIDGKLVISRGLSNTVKIPRFFNPRELVEVEF